MKTSSFDDYIAEEIRKDPSLAKGLKEVGKIIDVSFQIYTIRKQKGYTQSQLAKKAGMHQSNIARLEDASYANVPSNRTLSKIAKVLDVDIITLLNPPYKWEYSSPFKVNADLENISSESQRTGCTAEILTIYKPKNKIASIDNFIPLSEQIIYLTISNS